MRPVVDVGVVTWNTAELTSTALRALVDTDQGCDIRLLVHDNASTDGTPDALARAVPEAEIVRGPENVGFARAVNQLLARSDAQWFLALNSDAWPEPGAVGRMVAAGNLHPEAGAVAARLVRPDGSLEHSTHPFPRLDVAMVDAIGGRNFLSPRWAEQHCLQGAWEHDRGRVVDWAVGAGLLMRRRTVEEVGGFEERFFMYVEDLEWCWRAKQRGWDIWFEPSAVIRHVGNASGTRRLGEGKLALEEANLRVFSEEALGATRGRLYRGLRAAAFARRYALTRVTGDAAEAGHWRLRLKAALGFVPPPVLRPAAPNDTTVATAPEVCVVVPTRGRAQRLERLVEALEKQTLDASRYEVVMVDDHSPDDTTSVLEELAARSPMALCVLRTPAQSGPAAARNIGWASTNAPVIAFTDDDCLPDPDWLRSGLAHFDGQPRVVAGCTTFPPEQAHLIGRPFARAMVVDSARFLETCNVFYRRADLAAVGGFDPRFRRPSGEDTHLALRVLELGVEPVFAPDAVVFHDVRPGGLGAAVTEATRWADLPLILKDRAYARRRLVDHLVFWKATHPRALLAVAGLALASRWRPALLLILPWLDWRLRRDPVAAQVGARVATLPGALALDLTEVATMVRGSWRHKTILL